MFGLFGGQFMDRLMDILTEGVGDLLRSEPPTQSYEEFEQQVNAFIDYSEELINGHCYQR